MVISNFRLLGEVANKPEKASDLAGKLTKEQLLRSLPRAIKLVRAENRDSVSVALELSIHSDFKLFPVFLSFAEFAEPSFKKKKGFRLNDFYKVFEIPKKSGGKRSISVPVMSLKTLQTSLLRRLEKEEVSFVSTGFRKGKSIMLYYVGWNPRSTVRFSFYSGLAISRDNGFTFKRYSRAPIIERTNLEPYVNASPMVIKIKKKYFMYYVSGEGWINPDLPRYNIKIATSINGKEWKRLNKTAIDFKNRKENALARPCVVKFGSKYYMWFSKKGKNYRTGFAYSKDGINWKRNDSLVDLNIGKTSFDNKMICYPYIFSFKKKIYCIYNGNNYGY